MNTLIYTIIASVVVFASVITFTLAGTGKEKKVEAPEKKVEVARNDPGGGS